MIEMHDETKEYLDAFLERYTEDSEAKVFNALHMYPAEPAYPNGFIDACFFRLVGFHFKSNRKRELGTHDELRIEYGVKIDMVRIFADGSTFLRFQRPVQVGMFQSADVYLAEDTDD